MSVTRRSFLRSATFTTLSAGLALGGTTLIFGQHARRRVSSDFPIPVEAQRDALFYFNSNTFSPYVGDIFQVAKANGEMIELELIRVKEHEVKESTRISTRRSRLTESFSLTFSSNEPLSPFTSIQKLSHPALGNFDLFLTSHTTNDGTFLYEAVFNHIQ